VSLLKKYDKQLSIAPRPSTLPLDTISTNELTLDLINLTLYQTFSYKLHIFAGTMATLAFIVIVRVRLVD